MRFRYALQKIVDLKSNEKAQAEWNLSNAISRLKVEEQSLHELHETRRFAERKITEAAASSVTCAELTMLQSYVEHIDSLIARKKLSLQRAKQEVSDSSQHLAAKMKDEKVWLKARERSYMAFRAEVLRKEQYEIDELAAVRFGKS